MRSRASTALRRRSHCPTAHAREKGDPPNNHGPTHATHNINIRLNTGMHTYKDHARTTHPRANSLCCTLTHMKRTDIDTHSALYHHARNADTSTLILLDTTTYVSLEKRNHSTCMQRYLHTCKSILHCQKRESQVYSTFAYILNSKLCHI